MDSIKASLMSLLSTSMDTNSSMSSTSSSTSSSSTTSTTGSSTTTTESTTDISSSLFQVSNGNSSPTIPEDIVTMAMDQLIAIAERINKDAIETMIMLDKTLDARVDGKLWS